MANPQAHEDPSDKGAETGPVSSIRVAEGGRRIGAGVKSTWAWFALVVCIALFGRWQAYAAHTDRCALDGNRIVPIHQVDLLLEGRIARSFCSIRCATDWPDAPPAAHFQVRDEVTGEVLDSSLAVFVESGVVAVAARQDRTHAFGRRADALDHIIRYGGAQIPSPFANEGSE